MNKGCLIQRITALLATLLILSSCGTTNSTQQSTFVESGNWPAMWRMADNDTEIYLFGTFHLLPPNTQWQSPMFTEAMLTANTTYFEADTTSPEAALELQQAMATYGFNPPGVTLSMLLGEQRAREFAQLTELVGVPMDNLESLRPWAAAVTLSIMAYQKQGLDISSGADMLIERAAKQQGDEIRFLESGLSQIKALAKLDDLEDFASIDDTLEQLKNFDVLVDQMVDAWRTGNTQSIEALITKQIKDVSPQANELLLINRNRNWVEQIQNLMNEDGVFFIAVGAGHLVGEESVVDLLRSSGRSVDRVQ